VKAVAQNKNTDLDGFPPRRKQPEGYACSLHRRRPMVFEILQNLGGSVREIGLVQLRRSRSIFRIPDKTYHLTGSVREPHSMTTSKCCRLEKLFILRTAIVTLKLRRFYSGAPVANLQKNRESQFFLDSNPLHAVETRSTPAREQYVTEWWIVGYSFVGQEEYKEKWRAQRGASNIRFLLSQGTVTLVLFAISNS
jgi:hypothetical protein